MKPVYFIDGNHQCYPTTRALTAPAAGETWLVYCPRGSILTLDGFRVGFPGGAGSLSGTANRTPDVDWCPEEEVIRSHHAAPLLGGHWAGSIDLLLTHTPPSASWWTTEGTRQHPPPWSETCRTILGARRSSAGTCIAESEQARYSCWTCTISRTSASRRPRPSYRGEDGTVQRLPGWTGARHRRRHLPRHSQPLANRLHRRS